MGRRMVELQSQFGRCGEEKNLALARIQILPMQPVTHH
jgi:hypothetical protein